jgi:hypothetical protein
VYRQDPASARRVAGGIPCDNAPRVKDPPVAGALRRPRRAWTASENGRYVHSRPPRGARAANAAYYLNLVRKNLGLVNLFTSYFQQEFRAYWVSSLIAQGLGMPGLHMSSGVNIWSAGWSANALDRVRAVAIALHVNLERKLPIPPVWDPLGKR